MSTMTHTNTRGSGLESKSGIREHTDAIKSDVEALKQDTAAAASAVSDTVADKAKDVADLARQGGERLQDTHDSLCEQVRKRPTAAVLLALGAGVVLGRIASGR